MWRTIVLTTVGPAGWSLGAPATQPATRPASDATVTAVRPLKGRSVAERSKGAVELPPLAISERRPERPRLPETPRYAVPTMLPPLYVPGTGRYRLQATPPSSGPAPAIQTPPLTSEKGGGAFPPIGAIPRLNMLEGELSGATEIPEPADLLPAPKEAEAEGPAPRVVTPPKPAMK